MFPKRPLAELRWGLLTIVSQLNCHRQLLC